MDQGIGINGCLFPWGQGKGKEGGMIWPNESCSPIRRLL
jgi:hypothetical protein